MNKSEELTEKIMKTIPASLSNIQFKETAKKVLAILEESGIDNLKDK